MDQIRSGNRRITVEYAKFHGEFTIFHSQFDSARLLALSFGSMVSMLCLLLFNVISLFYMMVVQTTIGTVERNINGMLQYQSHSRSSEARDFALLIDNNSYVQNWSIIQISVILLTCSIQVSKSINKRFFFSPFSIELGKNVTKTFSKYLQQTIFNQTLKLFFKLVLIISGILCAKTVRHKYGWLWKSTNLMQVYQKPIITTQFYQIEHIHTPIQLKKNYVRQLINLFVKRNFSTCKYSY